MLGRAAILVALAAPAQAGVTVLEAGIICPAERGGESVPAPDTESGEIRLIDQELAFDLPDRAVPTEPDLSFGVRVGLDEGAAPVEGSMQVTHPPMGPRAVTRQSWALTLEPGGDALNLFTFDSAYEMVQGEWRFAVVVDGEEVAGAGFVVGPAGSNPRVDAVCLGGLMS